MKSYHRHALQAYRRSFFPALFLCIGQIIFWFIFVSIAIYTYRKISYYALLVCIPALLALFVFRFYIINKLLHLLDPLAPRCKSFASLLLSASYRLLTGVLWLSPLAVVLYRFYQYIFVLPATTFSSDFTRIGAFLSPDAALTSQLLIGTAVFFLLLLVASVVFLYGWRRSICFDLAQMEGLSFADSLHRAKRMRCTSRTSRFVNTILHAFILSPAIILPCALPLSQLMPLLSGKAMNDIQLIYVYLSAGIVSDGTLLLSLAIFLLLYLPWLPLRKLHNIAAVVVRHE